MALQNYGSPKLGGVLVPAKTFLARSTNPIKASTSKIASPTTSILGQVTMVLVM